MRKYLIVVEKAGANFSALPIPEPSTIAQYVDVVS